MSPFSKAGRAQVFNRSLFYTIFPSASSVEGFTGNVSTPGWQGWLYAVHRRALLPAVISTAIGDGRPCRC